MKTSSNYRNKSGRNTGNARAHDEGRNRHFGNAFDRSREDNYRSFPEDRNYHNDYDRENRHNYERGYNAYDRSHSNYGGYDRDNRENYGGHSYQERSGTPGYGRGFTEDRNYRNEGYIRSEGYKGRDSNDYNDRYDSGRGYYDPSDTYSRRDERGYTYRHDEDYERENRHEGPKGRYSWGREDADRSKGSYGYYESYPSYGQSDSYNDHERYEGKTGTHRSRTDKYGETDNQDYRRSDRRHRNSW